MDTIFERMAKLVSEPLAVGDFDAALLRLLQYWLAHAPDHMADDSFSAEVVENTGLKGEGFGMGGRLVIEFDAGDSGVNETEYDNGKLRLIARGDREQRGLTACLASLLIEILRGYGSDTKRVQSLDNCTETNRKNC